MRDCALPQAKLKGIADGLAVEGAEDDPTLLYQTDSGDGEYEESRLSAVAGLLQSGALDEETLVWSEDMDDWEPW